MGSIEHLKTLSRQLSELISVPEATPEPNHEPVKVIVAVHGIGDQFAFATVRSVADRFCQYMGLPAAIPLGRFHGLRGTITGAYIPSGNMKFFPVGLGFAEIYWADIPRAMVKEGHTLEESKRWARTIVERLQLSATGLRRLTKRQVQDNRLMVQVLEEMIQGVAVLDQLLLVARKAGLFSFDLNKLLNDFLNDVQVVAEFSGERDRMLKVFRDVMDTIDAQFPNAEFYIVAHSEGTVVSFLGLLSGLADPNIPERRPDWGDKIKGYMTIGSPLNKHVLFWPDLFEAYHPPAVAPARRIPWRNYYDKGDPIGFDLRATRNLLKLSGWSRSFEFNGPEDIEAASRVEETRQTVAAVRRRAEGAAPASTAIMEAWREVKKTRRRTTGADVGARPQVAEARKRVEEARRRAREGVGAAAAAAPAVKALMMAALAERIADTATAVPDPDKMAARALKWARKAEAKVKEAEKAAAKADPRRAKAQRQAEEARQMVASVKQRAGEVHATHQKARQLAAEAPEKADAVADMPATTKVEKIEKIAVTQDAKAMAVKAEKDRAMAREAETLAAEALRLAVEAERKADAVGALPEAAEAIAKAKQAETKIKQAEKIAPVVDRVDESLARLHDHGFTRYYFPGAAHNDYWNDEQVFGHFIQDVVDPDRTRPKLKQSEPRVEYEIPRDRFVANLTSYILPYVFAAALLLLGVYPLYKSVRTSIAPTEAKFETAGEILSNVLGLASLIAGMTVLARIPRLSGSPIWLGYAVLIFVAHAVVFHWLVDQKIRVKVGSFLLFINWGVLAIVLGLLVAALALLAWTVRRDAPGTNLWPIGRVGVFGVVVLIILRVISSIYSGTIDPETHSVVSVTGPIADQAMRRVFPATATGVLVALACAISLIAWRLSRNYPSLGMKPLIHTGGLLILVIVASSIGSRQSQSQVAKHLQEKLVDPERNTVIRLFDEAQRESNQASRLQERAEQEADPRAKQAKQAEAQKARTRAKKAQEEADAKVSRVAELDRQADVFSGDGPIWPVVLAGLLFLYLWWLAALLFDLTFVWHRYIRHAVGLDRLKEMIEGGA
jgi:hypothetical protein